MKSLKQMLVPIPDDKDIHVKSADIVAIAAFMISAGNVMDYMAGWMERSFFPCSGHVFSSSDVSGFFSIITPENRMVFFRRWIGPNLGEKTSAMT